MSERYLLVKSNSSPDLLRECLEFDPKDPAKCRVHVLPAAKIGEDRIKIDILLDSDDIKNNITVRQKHSHHQVIVTLLKDRGLGLVYDLEDGILKIINLERLKTLDNMHILNGKLREIDHKHLGKVFGIRDIILIDEENEKRIIGILSRKERVVENLHTLIKERNSETDLPQLAIFLLQSLQGLQALHNEKLIFGDFKLPNIEIVKEGEEKIAKLLDFDTIQEVDKCVIYQCFSCGYTPSSAQLDRTSFSNDVLSVGRGLIGLLAPEMLAIYSFADKMRLMFGDSEHDNLNEVYEELLSSRNKFIETYEYPEELVDIMIAANHPEQIQRPSLADIMDVIEKSIPKLPLRYPEF